MSQPTARELLDGIGDLYPVEGMLPALPEILAARVERVLALHMPRHLDEMEAIRAGYSGEGDYCTACETDEPWPCPTRRALDGLDE